MLQTTLDALAEGVLFFTVYAFLGWIAECCYVRLLGGIWVNRGFLHGPFAPVYGVGGLFLIYVLPRISRSLPVQFLIACAALSFIEYLTNWGMERLFQTRWWDYSGKKFNLAGRVCLLCSLYWGLLGILLVKVIQPVAAGLVYRLGKPWLYIFAACLMAFVAADTLYSVRRARDFGRIMGELKLMGGGLRQEFHTQQEVYQQKVLEYERDRALARQAWRRGIDEAKSGLPRNPATGEGELRRRTEEANEALRLALVRLKSTLARAADQREAADRAYRESLRMGVRLILAPVLRRKSLCILLDAFPGSGPGGGSRETEGLGDELKELIHKRQEINEKNHITEEESVMKKYICSVCGYIYDPEAGDPDSGIAPGTAFEDIPDDWCCPACGVAKDMFEAQ